MAVVVTLAAGCGGVHPTAASVTAVEKAFEAEGIALKTQLAVARLATTPALPPCGKHTDCGTATITVTLEKVSAPKPLAIRFASHHDASVFVWIYRSAAEARKARVAFQSRSLNVGSYLVHDNVMVAYILIPRSDTEWRRRVERALKRV